MTTINHKLTATITALALLAPAAAAQARHMSPAKPARTPAKYQRERHLTNSSSYRPRLRCGAFGWILR